MQEEASGNLAWRAGRTRSEIWWLPLAEDTVFGTLWDALLGTSPADARTQGARAEQLAAIGVLHRTEPAVAAEAARGHATSVDDSLAVDSTKVRHPALQRARSLLANVVLLSKDNAAQLARTLGQLRGSIDLATPERSKHVGIFFVLKCSGEASRRPHVRTPLLRGEATLLLLREAARARWRRGMPVTYAFCSMADCLATLAPCSARSRAMTMPQQPSEDSPSRRIWRACA